MTNIFKSLMYTMYIMDYKKWSILPETEEELKKIGKFGETQDGVIKKLISCWNENHK